LRPALAALPLLALAACAADSLPPRTVSERLCGGRGEEAVPVPRVAVPGAEVQRLAALGYSPAALRAADAVGALPALLRMERARPGGIEHLSARQEVTERILQGMLDAAGTIAEIDCEGERGDQLRTRLQARVDRRARQLGVAGLLLGAGTAALTGGLSLAGAATAGSVAGIAGGGAEAAAAGALLFAPAPTARLETPRNLLREAWDRPAEPRLFPASVWNHLARPGGTGPTPLDILLAEWRTPETLGESGTAEEGRRIALLLGEGGDYTPEMLEVRDRMLDLLEASIALMSQDLRTLLRQVRARVAGA
jgi:hypothetical protein